MRFTAERVSLHVGITQAVASGIASGTLNILTISATEIVASSTDSDLEAFSHNPADGSFAPLAAQPRANTNYPNQRFLSYFVELLLQRHFISRVKLTCLTTV